jgi:hypothetical protein
MPAGQNEGCNKNDAKRYINLKEMKANREELRVEM